MRIGAELQAGIGNAHELQQLPRPLAQCGARGAIVHPDGFGDLGADARDRIERGHWLLEDHRDVAAAGLHALPRFRVGHVGAAKGISWRKPFFRGS